MRIDVDALLLERQLEYEEEESQLVEMAIEEEQAQQNASLKRKADDIEETSPESISTASPSKPKAKQRKLKAKSDPIDGLPLPSPAPSSSRSKSHAKVTLRVALPKELEPFPCCLCVSRSTDDLLPVHDDVTHMWPLPPHLAIPKDQEGRLI